MKKMVLVVIAFVAITFFFTDGWLQTVTGYEQDVIYAMSGSQTDSDYHPGPSRPDGERRQRVNEPSTLGLMGTGVLGIGAYLLLRAKSKKK